MLDGEMANEGNNLAQLVEITGLDQESAGRLLKLYDDDLQLALNHHLEALMDSVPQNGTSGGNSSGNPNSAPAANPDIDYNELDANHGDDYVRPPIPSRREQLVMPEDDNFRFRKRRTPAFSVCPLRNFAREAELQEEQLNTYLDGGPASVGSVFTGNHSAAYDRNVTDSASTDGSYSSQSVLAKRARLADLFRPPVELLFWGTFRAARDFATQQNRWLIVNLQNNAEFRSQIMNRDIWSDLGIKEIVQRYFVLWQVSVDNPEGLRFKTFYKVDTMPYVCIIDPRTGEEKQAFVVVTAQTFCNDLNEYLILNSSTLDDVQREREKSTSSSRSAPTSTVTKLSNAPTPDRSMPLLTDPVPTTSETSTSTNAASQIEFTSCPSASPSTHKPAAELSEEDQLALAIKNSLQECEARGADDADEDVIILSDSEEEAESFENYLGNSEDPATIIQLRLPNGEKTQLEWPSTTTLRAIKLFVQAKYPDDTKEPYKIISTFPRQNILELDENETLIGAKLHPRAILHLHPDN